jgi:uncharacterized protein
MKLVCPICKTEVADAPDDFTWRPFCSQRCKRADLYNWLTGEYRISTSLEQGETEDEIKLS